MVVLGWLPVKPCRQGLSVKPRSRYWRQTGFVASSVLASYPPLIAGLAVRLRGWASSFLLTASNRICSPWITGPYNMHATALNALIEWGRVHEVRRSQPRLSGSLIQIFGSGRDPLLASVTGFNQMSLQPRAFRLVLPLDNCSWRFTLHARVSCQPSEPFRPVHRCL